MKKYIYIIAVALVSFLATSCSDFLEVSSSDELPDGEVITNLKEAQAALNGVYTRFQVRQYYGCDMITYGDVRGDDMGTSKNADRTNAQYKFTHTTSLTSTNGGYFWQYIYYALNRGNSLLNKINSGVVKTNSEAEKIELENIKAQVLTLRALMHFDLVRVYAQPYLKDKSADGIVIADKVYKKEDKPSRSSIEKVYEFMLNDLNTAINIADSSKSHLSKERTNGRANFWTAKSLLSKIYLYMGEWEQAYTHATDVINAQKYGLIYNQGYVNSWSEPFTSESIFEIYTSETENANREAIGYVYLPRNGTPIHGYGAVSVTDDFVALLQEDPADCRLGLLKKADYSAKGYLTKYPGREGNIYVNNAHVIRLSEIYLIASEAGVNANKPDASDYLNAIRKRANPNVTDVVATLDLVEKERRKELVGEGHRYFDITRNLGTKTVERKGYANNPINNKAYVPEISWSNGQTYLLILPIPSAETDNNENIKQNPGYLQ